MARTTRTAISRPVPEWVRARRFISGPSWRSLPARASPAGTGHWGIGAAGGWLKRPERPPGSLARLHRPEGAVSPHVAASCRFELRRSQTSGSSGARDNILGTADTPDSKGRRYQVLGVAEDRSIGVGGGRQMHRRVLGGNGPSPRQSARGKALPILAFIGLLLALSVPMAFADCPLTDPSCNVDQTNQTATDTANSVKDKADGAIKQATDVVDGIL